MEMILLNKIAHILKIFIHSKQRARVWLLHHITTVNIMTLKEKLNVCFQTKNSKYQFVSNLCLKLEYVENLEDRHVCYGLLSNT